MLNVLKWKWTPPAITVLLIVSGVLQQLRLLGQHLGLQSLFYLSPSA